MEEIHAKISLRSASRQNNFKSFEPPEYEKYEKANPQIKQ